MRDRGKEQYRRQADGGAASAGACHGDGCPFPYKGSEGDYKTGGYPDRCHGKTAVYRGRICKRRGCCD